MITEIVFLKVIFVSILSFADTVPTTTAIDTSGGIQAKAMEIYDRNQCKKTPDDSYCKKLETAAFSSSSDPCTNGSFYQDYTKAKQEFEAACSQANIELGGQNDIGCGYKMTSCRCLNSSSAQIGQISCPKKSGTTYAGDSDIPDAKLAASQIKTCPALASKDNSNYQKELEKAEDDVKSDRGKVDEAKEKAAKTDEDAQTKSDELADKATEAQSKYGEDQEAAQKSASEAQKGIMEQLSKLQDQSIQLDGQIGAQQLSISQAGLDAYKKKNAVDLNCHAQAVSTVSKFQAEALELNRAGKLNLGGQRDILRKVGLTDRQHWEAMAMKYYKWCLQSKPTLDAKDIADKEYVQAKSGIQQNIVALKKSKALLADQMKQVKDPNERCAQPAASAAGATACPTSGSQYCQSLCQAAATQNRLFQSFQANNAKMIAQANAAKLQGERKSIMAGQQAAQAEAQLTDDNTRVNGLRSYLGVARSAGGGSDDGKGYSNVTDKFRAFNDAAGTFVTCAKDTCATNTACTKASRYLTAIGSSVDYTKTDIAPTPQTASAAPSAHDHAPGPHAPSGTGAGDSAN